MTKSQSLSPSELYDLVWSKPMTVLAKEFGVSDQGLAKICRRNDIPTPERGYWAKLQAGKQVHAQPLSRHLRDSKAKITIQATEPKPKLKPVPKPEKSSDKASVEIPADLNRVHPVVARWIKDHEAEQAKRQKELRRNRNDIWFRPRELPDLTDKDLYRFRVTSAFLQAAGEAGIRVLDGKVNGTLNISVSGQDFEIKIVQKMRQVLRRAPEDESWTAYPEHHNSALSPTGYLRFAIVTYFGGSHTNEWVESDKMPAGQLIPYFIDQILEAASISKEWHNRLEEQRLEIRREEAKRLEAQRLARLENERWDRFRASAARWREAEILRSFLAALDGATLGSDDIDGMPRGEFLEWVAGKIDEFDPLVLDVAEDDGE